MELLDIQLMLDEAYNNDFLSAIELIVLKEKEYKKSEFYKNTQIPILKLYESYVVYTQQKYDWVDRLNQMIQALDSGLVENKLNEIIIKLRNNPEVKEIIQSITSQFNMDALLENNKELADLIKKVKP